MASLVIKDLPEGLHRRLRVAAKKNRRSIIQEAIVGLDLQYREPVAIRFPKPVKLPKPVDHAETARMIRRMRDGEDVE